MDDAKKLGLIVEAVKYCQRVRDLGMPSSCYTKALREPVHFLWERRHGSKIQCPKYRSVSAIGLAFGNRRLKYDHAVPFGIVQKKLLELSEITNLSVSAVLEQFCVVALITADEDALLDRLRLGDRMPPDWDEVDKLARYKAAGIEVVKNSR
jgi:hypothetical protein